MNTIDQIRELQSIIALLIKHKIEGLTEAEGLLLTRFLDEYGNPSTVKGDMFGMWYKKLVK